MLRASSRAPPRVRACVATRARHPPRLARGRSARATTHEDVFVDALVHALGAPALDRDDDEELDAYVARALAGRAVDVSRVARIVAECAGLPEATAAVATVKTPTREARAELARARGVASALFNACVSAYNRLKDWESCQTLVRLMEDDAGCAPDAVSFSLAASAMARAARDGEARAFLLAAESVLKRGTRRNKKKKKVRVDADAWLKVLYETDDVAAVHKPAGMLTHSSEGAGKSPSLSDVALAQFGELSDLNGSDKRGIVSRLDKPTSGVVILAKNNKAHAELVTQFYQRAVTKTYWALVDGEVPLDAGGTIIEPVDGRPAKSDWEVVETFVGDRWKYALVRVNPRTGRKHQIRVHMASVGCPLTGDTLYRRGRAKTLNVNAPKCVLDSLSGGKTGTTFFLHAGETMFDVAGKRVRVNEPLPVEFSDLLDKLHAASSKASS